MNLIIFGAPGSGKGTYASRLQLKLNLVSIATGDILREIMKENTPLGTKVKGYVEKGLLVPDSVVNEVLQQRLAKTGKKGYILDGYPRTVDQARTLDTITKIDAVVLLQVPEWIIVERLSTRRICKDCGTVYNIRYLKPKVDMVCDKCGGELYQRSDDTPKVIKERIQVYEKQTQPILDYYREKKTPLIEFKTESIDMPPEVAIEEITKGIKKLGLT